LSLILQKVAVKFWHLSCKIMKLTTLLNKAYNSTIFCMQAEKFRIAYSLL